MVLKQISKEIKVFEKNRASLVEKSRGKFALVYKDKVIGIFDTEEEAIQIAYNKFGNVPFLVKEILEEDRIIISGQISNARDQRN
ncbi:MAG: hypothetical protein FVQ83_08185 [Chloroflexi bacterium]|nr:hypothetical protein [Chloroflexota bacterium]